MNEYRVTLKFSPHLTGLTKVCQPVRLKIIDSSAATAANHALTMWMAKATEDEKLTLSDVIVSEIDSLVRAIVGRKRTR